jgi:hypothetical protein
MLLHAKRSSFLVTKSNSGKGRKYNNMLKKNISTSIIIYVLIFLAAFLFLAPMITSNLWPATHETARYILLLDHFKGAFVNGVLYPRFLPDANGGYGYPTFLFYQPGFFFTALPFSFLPNYPLSTMYAVLLFLFFIGGIGAYKLCKELSDSLTGLFCSILFLLTPYLYVNLYARGDLSELMAMLLCPWPLFFLTLLKKRTEEDVSSIGPMVGIAISLLMLIISHPATAMFFCVIFSLISVYLSINMLRLKKYFLLKVAISTLLGLALSAPYWFTLCQMKRYVNLDPGVTGFYTAYMHTVYFHQFFSRYWGFGLFTVNAGAKGMSFQLGLPHFILATIGVLLGRKNTIIRASYILYIAFILLMTPIAFLLWKDIIFLRYVQFPWRILSITATLQIICVAGLKKILSDRKFIVNGVTIVLILLFVSALWYSNQFQIGKNPIDVKKVLNFDKEHRLENFYTYTFENEFMPKTALKQTIAIPRGNTPMLVFNQPVTVRALEGNSQYRICYQVINKLPTDVMVNQIYIPGWKVRIDGKDIPTSKIEQNLTADGRMFFSISPIGSHIVNAFYDGPPGWRMCNIVIIFLILGIVTFCGYDERSRNIRKRIALKEDIPAEKKYF